MRCIIRNGTPYAVKLKEVQRGYRERASIVPGGKYIFKFDHNETFNQFEISGGLGVKKPLSLSCDDFSEWSEVTVVEGPDGALECFPLPRGVSDKNLEAAQKSAKGVSLKFDEALRSCDDLEKLCGRAKICRYQCNHLLQSYKQGIQKMAQLYTHLIEDDVQVVQRYRDDRLTKLEKSLDSLEFIVCDAKDMLGSCANELGKVALVVSIRRPPVEKDMEVYSDFDLLIRELEWHLDVIKYLIGPSEDANFVWSPTMCRYVLAQKKAPDHEKPLIFSRLDRDELQSGLQDGSIYSPNSMIHDTILKRCEAQDPQSRPMDLGAFEIDHLDLDLLHTCTDGELGKRKFKKLGGGSAKKVYEGTWYGQSVAIATIRLGYILDDPDVPDRSPISPTPAVKVRNEASEMFRNEVKRLLQLQHPKVVSLFGWAETTDAPAPIKKPDEKHCVHGGYIVTEKMQCNLDTLIQMRKGDTSRYGSGPFSHSVGIDILLQIVEAMLHVHNRGVMHRDLKPGNFLVSPRSSPARPGADTYYDVKLIDFGSSKVFVREDGNTCNVGTAGYGDPDMMKKAVRGKYGMSVDVYSFSMTCYQVITGKILFEGFGISERARNKERPPIPSFVLHGLKKLTEECWHDNPRKRPSFKEIQKRLWTIKMTLALEECWDASPKEKEFLKGLADTFFEIRVALLATLAVLAAALLCFTLYSKHSRSG